MFVVVPSSWRGVSRDPEVFAFARRCRSSSWRGVSRDPVVLFLLLSFAFMLSSWDSVTRDPVVFAFASVFSSVFICVICGCFMPLISDFAFAFIPSIL